MTSAAGTQDAHVGERRIGAVVLAAGASRRMGRNKLLLPVDGVPMVRRTVQHVLDAGLAPVVVVTGHEADAVREALAGLDVRHAHNADATGPTSGSLHAGLAALDDTVDATLVMLADMVHVTVPMLRAVADSLRTSDAPLAVSRYGDVLAPPLGFHRALWPALLAWHGEGCGKAVVQAHRSEAVQLDWPLSALQDIDTPEDYAALTGGG
jgi:molybdenum cofactor cytidylyltransferase